MGAKCAVGAGLLTAVVLAFSAVLLGPTAACAQSHSATLSWTPATQPSGITIASWNVLRGTTTGGPYTQIANVPGATTSYTDTSVSSGHDYFYVVQEVDTAGAVSAYSNQAAAVIPNSDPPLTISTTSLPPATAGTSYSVTITANGGVGPYTWSGTGVDRLTFSGTGLLSGTPLQTGTFIQGVTVKDSTGATASVSLALTVKAPPTVYIDMPTSGATVSGIVSITGWAVDNAAAVGTAISGVQVKLDGTVVGTATYGLSRADVCVVYPGRPGCPNVGYSFSLNTSTLSVGSHNITVTATDSDGTSGAGSSSVAVNVQTPKPTVWIDTPTLGATVSGIVTVIGWAVDNATTLGTAISSVQVKVDGTVVGTATYGLSRPDVCAAYPGRPGCPNVGYSYSLNTSTLSVGTHTITVTATDSDGAPDAGSSSVTVNVQAPAPTVYIDTPAPGTTVLGNVTVSGWAVDNAAAVGTAISSVQVKVDGTVVGTATYGLSRPDVCAAYPGRPGCPNVGYSYSLNTSTLNVGSHTITVTATDSDTTADSGSASVTITK